MLKYSSLVVVALALLNGVDSKTAHHEGDSHNNSAIRKLQEHINVHVNVDVSSESHHHLPEHNREHREHISKPNWLKEEHHSPVQIAEPIHHQVKPIVVASHNTLNRPLLRPVPIVVEQKHKAIIKPEFELNDASSSSSSSSSSSTSQQQAPAPHHKKHHNFWGSIGNFFSSGRASNAVSAIGNLISAFSGNGGSSSNQGSVADLDEASAAALVRTPGVKELKVVTQHLLFELDKKLETKPEDADEAFTALIEEDFTPKEWEILENAQKDAGVQDLENKIHEAWLDGDIKKLTDFRNALKAIVSKVDKTKTKPKAK